MFVNDDKFTLEVGEHKERKVFYSCQLNPGTLETGNPMSPKPLESWNLGTLEPWNPGTQEPWNTGTLEPWNLETLEPWNTRTLEHRNPGTQEPWNTGTLAP